MEPRALWTVGYSDGPHAFRESVIMGQPVLLTLSMIQVLFAYGSKIRARSIASRKILAADSGRKHEDPGGV